MIETTSPFSTTTLSNRVPEPGRIVRRFHMLLLLGIRVLASTLLHHLLSAGILEPEVDRHEQREEEGHADDANEQRMALDVPVAWSANSPEFPHRDLSLPGTIALQINVGGDDASAVAAHDLHGDARASLKTSPDVVSVPGETERDLRIDSCKAFHEPLIPRVQCDGPYRWLPRLSPCTGREVSQTRPASRTP